MDCTGLQLMSESPPRDAPSPTAGDDPFLNGVEGEDLPESGEDMEMDDEDKPGPSTCFLKPPKEYAASIFHSHSTGEIDTRYQVNCAIIKFFAKRYKFKRMGAVPNCSNSQIVNFHGMVPSTVAPIRHDTRPVMDPRQMRFYPPPIEQQQQQKSMQSSASFGSATNNVVSPPGLSPPSSQASSKCNSNVNQIGITQPPPNLFNIPLPGDSAENSGNIPPDSPMAFNSNNLSKSFPSSQAPVINFA